MYLTFYNLKEEPFRLTPDPRFLHLAEPHRAALTTLVQGVVLRKGFVVLVGPVGTGKTTLLHAALQILTTKTFAKSALASAFLVNPTLSREELLEAILAEFEIKCSSNSKPNRLTALYQMLLETQRRGGTGVLLVDEAHLLSLELMEEIRLLSNTETYREKLIQILLVGQPELLTLLAQPECRALQQRVASRCQLRALSLAETRAFVANRLYAAGLRGPSPFQGPALESIHRYSQAVPRLINLLCDNALTIGHLQQQAHIGPEIIEEAAFELGLVGTAATTPAAAPPSDGQLGSIAPKSSSRPPELKTPKSSVDLLIEAMRQGRAIARE